jgi:hypothetical protein
MSRGGKRVGSGRKPGAVTKKTEEPAESTLHLWKHERLEFLQSLKRKREADVMMAKSLCLRAPTVQPIASPRPLELALN